MVLFLESSLATVTFIEIEVELFCKHFTSVEWISVWSTIIVIVWWYVDWWLQRKTKIFGKHLANVFKPLPQITNENITCFIEKIDEAEIPHVILKKLRLSLAPLCQPAVLINSTVNQFCLRDQNKREKNFWFVNSIK